MASAEVKIGRMLEAAEIELNGPRPEDPQVNTTDPSAYERILRGGTLAVGDAYMNGEWDCEALDVLAYKMGKSEGKPIQHLGLLTLAKAAANNLFRNHQRGQEAEDNVKHHYDAGNELYTRMLDPTMAYSCAVWEKGVDNLADAQLAKYDLVCRKLGLESGMKVLDIGCGWGGMANFAVENYGVDVVGVTLSDNQLEYIQEHDFGFEARKQDYRAIEGEKFDRVYSIGMFEHVGRKNYREHFSKVRELTTPDGRAFTHTIGAEELRLFLNPWMDKRIFPGAYLPTEGQIRRAVRPLLHARSGFAIADVQEMGYYYDPTLMAWNGNLQAAWPELAEFTNEDGSPMYDERFRRMEEYYLLTCAGYFRNGKNRLFQVVLTDPEAAADYEPVREAA